MPISPRGYKPRNHVTEALSKRGAAPKALPMPDIDEELVEYLEALFPPRCYEPGSENLEAHLRYAGMVDLVAMLRVSYEEQTSEQIDPEDIEGDAD